MDLISWSIFCAAIVFGSYVQSVAGFAMGMIIMAAGGASGAIPLPVLTAVVSLVSGLNIFLALRGHYGSVDLKLLRPMICGQLPAVVLGVWLIDVLDQNARSLLELMLGMFITVGGLSLMFRTRAAMSTSPRWACVLAGAGGGLFGGLFSASGPVMGWFIYRQPLPLPIIRATLLAFFAISTVFRTILVGSQGGLTNNVLQLSAVAVPLVFIGTWLGHHARPPVSDAGIKHGVTVLLVSMGMYIVVHAW